MHMACAVAGLKRKQYLFSCLTRLSSNYQRAKWEVVIIPSPRDGGWDNPYPAVSVGFGSLGAGIRTQTPPTEQNLMRRKKGAGADAPALVTICQAVAVLPSNRKSRIPVGPSCGVRGSS